MISRTGREKLWAALGLLAIEAVLLARSAKPFAPQPPAFSDPSFERPLTPGISVERSLPTGQIDLYRFPLHAGDFLHVVALQEGVDVSLTLVPPSGKETFTVDSPNGDHFSESLFAVAKETGLYHLRVRSEKGSSENRGYYRLELDKPRRSSPSDRLRARAALSFARGEALRRRGALQSHQDALREYGKALELWSVDGNREQQGATFYRLGWIHEDLRELEAARDDYSRALAVLAGRGDAAVVCNRLGRVYAALGRADLARDLFQRALRSGDLVIQAGALNNLGSLYRLQGEPLKAQKAIESALALARKIGLRKLQMDTATNLMGLYVDLGDLPRALETGLRALEIQRSGGGGAQEAEILLQLGFTCNRIGWRTAALRYLGEALTAARRTGDARYQVEALAEIGGIDLEEGDVQGARAVIDEAFRLSKGMTDKPAQGNALAMAGLLRGALGDGAGALELLDRAESIYRRWEDLGAVASILKARAMVLRDQGRLDAAREAIEESLRLIELLRSRPGERDLRASVVASRSDYYALCIEVLMLLHRRDPAAGFDRRAFAVSELMRARVPLEELAEAHLSSPAASRPAELGEIQALLDPDTALLAYSLGEKRSFLWKIKDTSVEAFELPPGAALAPRVQRAHALLTRPHPKRPLRLETARSLAALSRDLLAPLAGKLTEGRLVIVADGFLRYVPFAALPEGDGEPLVVRHSLVSLPSASLAALLRRAAHERYDSLIAVFADPVFRSDDHRVASFVRTRAAGPFDRLERLSYASREADAIARLAPPGQVLEALGFAASRERMMRPDISRCRYLHIATHSLINPHHPHRSGIVLSEYDAKGRPVDGFLRSSQIYGLKLTADLVVLSACQTAVDEKLHSEGLSSLARAFMHAGAKRVMVSLWDIDDHATSELMPRFYDALLRQGMPPAEALRKAQIDMLHSPSWSAPYYWAGFILQGDWH